jgi:hypothetical protein
MMDGSREGRQFVEPCDVAVERAYRGAPAQPLVFSRAFC